MAAQLNPEILVVDEVLAVGDAEFQKKCLGKMGEVARGGRTVLFVSHSMAAVQTLCTSCLLLASGQTAYRGDVASTVDAYLGSAHRDIVKFTRGPLKQVRVRQLAQSLIFEGTFATETALPLPSFGFVISDAAGTPVCGVNPRISGIDRADQPYREGVARAVLRQPRLMDGLYRLSVWFGDGHQDFVEYRDCLSFEVTGMAGIRRAPASAIGHVFPDCVWSFHDHLTASDDAGNGAVATQPREFAR